MLNSLYIRYNEKVNKRTRSEWLELLERLATQRPDEAQAEWAEVMTELGLGSKYFLAVHQAIQDSKWREAENPLAYIKTVAKRAGAGEKRRAERLGLGVNAERPVATEFDADGEKANPESTLEYLEHRQSSGEPTKELDGVWRTAPGPEVAHDFQLVKPERKPRRAERSRALASFARKAKQVEAELRAQGRYAEVEEEPEIWPDWQQWSANAGLSEWEKKVAVYKMSHIGREQALREQPDEESRLALQAAWKSFERTALERLRAVAPKGEEDEP